MRTGIVMPVLYMFVIVICLSNKSQQFLMDTNIDATSRCPITVAHGKYLHVFRDRCFEFVITNKKYWVDARHDCQEKGGDLVVISDADTQNFVMTTLRNLGNTHDGIWMGLTDRRHELHWEWVNGEPLTGYNNWAYRQGGSNALHYTQDCAQIRTDDHGLWHDRECHLWPNTFSYICEFEMLPMPTTKPPATTKLTSKAAPSTKTTASRTTTKTTSKATTQLPTTKTTKVSSTAPSLTTTTMPMSHTSTSLLARTSYVSNINTTLITRPNILLTDLKTVVSSTLLTILTTKTLSSDSPTTQDGDTRPLPTKESINRTVSPQGTTDAVLLYSTSNFTQSVNQTKSSTSATEIISETPEVHSSTGSVRSASFSFLSSKHPDKTASTTPEHECSLVDCDTRCPHGYSGLYVGPDGCVECSCL